MCGAHLHPAAGVDGLTTGSVMADSPITRSTAAATGAYWRLVRSPRPTDPGLMSGLGVAASSRSPTSAGTWRCRNVQVQVGARVRLVLGASRAHGLGVFVAKAAAAGDFVGEYVGELVSGAPSRSSVRRAGGKLPRHSVTNNHRRRHPIRKQEEVHQPPLRLAQPAHEVAEHRRYNSRRSLCCEGSEPRRGGLF